MKERNHPGYGERDSAAVADRDEAVPGKGRRIDLSVIIVSFNVKQFLLNCLRSVYKAAGALKIEVIVIDNASADDSLSAVLREYPTVIGIQNNQNVGFGTACNQGLSVAKGDFLLLLNPDVIVEETLFEALLPDMRSDPGIGLMGCKILNEDGSLQLSCRRSFPTPWTALSRLLGLSRLFPKSPLFAKYNLTYLDENERCEPDAISGAFMLMSRKAYEKTGGFDEHFFMYGEDLDLCDRVRGAGFRVVYNPKASIIHFKGQSFSPHVDTRYHFYQAMKIFARKHRPRQFGVLGVFNLAISLRYLVDFLKNYSLQFVAVMVDFGCTVLLMEVLARIRYGFWFPFPDMAYPTVYFILFGVQVPVYGWFGVYSSKLRVKRKIVAAATATWLILTMGAYFSKEFAFSRFIFLGLLVSAPLAHLFWRAIVQRVTRESAERRAVILTLDDSYVPSDWVQLKYVLLQGMDLVGIVVQNAGGGRAGYYPVLGTERDRKSSGRIRSPTF